MGGFQALGNGFQAKRSIGQDRRVDSHGAALVP